MFAKLLKTWKSFWASIHRAWSWLKSQDAVTKKFVKLKAKRLWAKIKDWDAAVNRKVYKLWNESRVVALQIIALIGLIFFGLLTLKAFQAHNVGMSTLFPLGLFISVKLLVTASNNKIEWPFLRRVFFSILNFLWLGVWFILAMAKAAGLERGNANG